MGRVADRGGRVRGRLWVGLAIAIGCGDDSDRSEPFGGDPFPGSPMGDSGDDDGDDGDSGDDGAATDDAMVDDGGGGSTGAPDDPATFDDIAVIPMPEGWMVHADGSWTYPMSNDPAASPFFALAQEFYALHPDEYDFISVYTEGLVSEE